MPTFKTNDGEKFTAPNAKALVAMLAGTSFGKDEISLHTYMEQVAERSERAASVTLRHDNCDNFVADMLMHGLLTVEPENA